MHTHAALRPAAKSQSGLGVDCADSKSKRAHKLDFDWLGSSSAEALVVARRLYGGYKDSFLSKNVAEIAERRAAYSLTEVSRARLQPQDRRYRHGAPESPGLCLFGKAAYLEAR